MEKIWLAHYPAGVPADASVDAYRSIGEVFVQTVKKFGPLPAFANMGAEITFDELERNSRNFAAYLQSSLKLPPGARIALMMPNLLQYPVALFGVLRAGYVVVNCNPLYTPRELEHQLVDSGANAIVILENFAHVLEKCSAEDRDRACDHGADWRYAWNPQGDAGQFRRQIRQADGPGLEHPGRRGFPSRSPRRGPGTNTARPMSAPTISPSCNIRAEPPACRKAPCSRMAISSPTCSSFRAWVQPFLNEGSEAVVMALPLYHIFALTANCLTFMKIGASQHADHQSARYSGLRQGAVATAIHHSDRRQHAFQRAAAQSATSRISISSR